MSIFYDFIPPLCVLINVVFFSSSTFSTSFYLQVIILSIITGFFNLFSQYTATGVAGLHGLTVTSPVIVETRQESANAINLNQPSEGMTARVQQLKPSPAICTAVYVFIFFISLFRRFVANRAVERHEYAT